MKNIKQTSEDSQTSTDESKKQEQEKENKFYFKYKETEIETKFRLTDEQEKGLKFLIDNILSGDLEPVTLSGFAGTGKTTLIKYLEKWLKKQKKYGYKIQYSAPTHAATVYLGLNVGYLPMTVQSIVVNRMNKFGRLEKSLSSKFDIDPFKKNILIVDESSMISREDLYHFINTLKKFKVKIVFMGDKAQIPEITTSPNKYVSDVFTKFSLFQLSQVQRTKDNGILKVLTEIRNNPNGVLPIISNTDTLKFYSPVEKKDFFEKFIEKYKECPEETVFISYKNSEVKAVNNKAREIIYGEDTDGLLVGEYIVGYGGYNNKSIINDNLANSIKYRVTKVEMRGTKVVIEGFSEKANQINEELGKMKTTYLQLSPTDSLCFSELKENNLKYNNQFLSEIFKKIFSIKKNAIEEKNWQGYSKRMEDATEILRHLEIGDCYVYNPLTEEMELFNSFNHIHKRIKKEYPELILDKGIDYAYAITIHKSQGATYGYVFFNASSTEENTNPLIENGVKVGTEGNSLNYVGMSRASQGLFVKHGSKVKMLE